MIIKKFRIFESINDNISTLEDIFADISDEFNVKIRPGESRIVYDMLMDFLREERPNIHTIGKNTLSAFTNGKLFVITIDGILKESRIKEITSRCNHENFTLMFMSLTTILVLKDKDEVVKNILEYTQ